ncbi:MAG: hypothetical protein HY326_10325 [Chloroflexi bacterium]|nr:hypothetical protein [Chloroflexota bacterium]
MVRQHLGIIDCFTVGFNIVSRRVWLILLPILLDLLYWAGPRLSPAPLLRPLVESAVQNGATDPETQDVFRRMVESTNLLTLLSTSSLGVPSFQPAPGDVPLFGEQSVWMISQWAAFVGLGVLLFLLGNLLGSGYLAALAIYVKQGNIKWAEFPRQIASVWWRVFKLQLLALVALITYLIPLSLVAALTAVINPALPVLVMSLAWVPVMWALLYFNFSLGAIALSDAGPRQAVRLSYHVVRRNLWPTIGLILISGLLVLGLDVIWQQLTAFTFGAVIGIVANAFIGCSVAATSLVFYQDRLRQWLTSEATARSKYPA